MTLTVWVSLVHYSFGWTLYSMTIIKGLFYGFINKILMVLLINIFGPLYTLLLNLWNFYLFYAMTIGPLILP